MSDHIASISGAVCGTLTIEVASLVSLCRSWPSARDLRFDIARHERHFDADAPFECLPDVKTALYVFVDDEDRCLYVGKTQRTFGSLADRFDAHHALIDDVDAVWVIVLNNSSTDFAVRQIERGFIQHYRPPLNVQGR